MGAGRENPGLTNAAMSAAKDIKITDLNVHTPLDHANALFGLGNKKSLYFMMLGRFLAQTLL